MNSNNTVYFDYTIRRVIPEDEVHFITPTRSIVVLSKDRCSKENIDKYGLGGFERIDGPMN